MRYLLCAMLLVGLVGCDEGADNTSNANSNGSAATSNSAQHDHEHGGEHDHEQIDHFEGKKAKDWKAAIANLKQYNQKLEAALAQDQISTEDLAKIHNWSYTLENAVGRLRTELKKTAAHLEEVHLGSERGETDRIREHGRKYLEGLAPLLADEQPR
jgi:hypothetical protein